MYINVENSKTYHFQLKSLKNTQYLGLGGHFSDSGKTGQKVNNIKIENLTYVLQAYIFEFVRKQKSDSDQLI